MKNMTQAVPCRSAICRIWIAAGVVQGSYCDSKSSQINSIYESNPGRRRAGWHTYVKETAGDQLPGGGDRGNLFECGDSRAEAGGAEARPGISRRADAGEEWIGDAGGAG